MSVISKDNINQAVYDILKTDKDSDDKTIVKKIIQKLQIEITQDSRNLLKQILDSVKEQRIKINDEVSIASDGDGRDTVGDDGDTVGDGSDTDDDGNETDDDGNETDDDGTVSDNDSDKTGTDMEDDDIVDDYDDHEYDDVDIETTTKKGKKRGDIIANLEEIVQIEDEENEDDDKDYEEDLKKFDKNIRENQITNYHQELINANFDEVLTLCKVVRNSDGIIIDPLHKTLPFLTKFEKTRILGSRTKQLNRGAEPFIKVPENIIQSHLIAEMELRQKLIPYIIVRPLPNGKKEYWMLKDLEILDL